MRAFQTTALWIVVSLTVFLSPKSIQANELTLAGVANGAQLVSQSARLYQTSDVYLSGGLGALLEFWLASTPAPPVYGLECGLLLMNRSFGSGNESDSITMLQLPVLLRRKWKHISVGLGPYLGWGLGNIESSTRGSIPYSAASMNQLDLGYAAALGFHFAPFGIYNQNTHPKITVEVRYLSSFKNLSTDPLLNSGFKEVQLLFGLRLCLSSSLLLCNPD